MSSGKRVNFEGSSPPSEARSRRSRDSGVGSSSTEQANSGGKSDRRFTAQDREDQRYNVHALQEALDAANKNLRDQKKKTLGIDEALSNSHKVIREKEALIRGLMDENNNIKIKFAAAQDEIAAARYQVDQHKDAFDDMRDQRDEWRQRCLSIEQPVGGSPVMSGGSGQSSDGVKRSKSKSKRDTKDQTERLKTRINKTNKEEEPSSSKLHRSSSRRRGSLSIDPGSTSRRPYIEEPEDRSRPPLSGNRHFSHYTAAPPISPTIIRMEPPAMSHVPRTTHPAVSPIYQTAGYQQTGDYVPLPLPDPRGRRGH